MLVALYGTQRRSIAFGSFLGVMELKPAFASIIVGDCWKLEEHLIQVLIDVFFARPEIVGAIPSWSDS